MEKQRKVLIGLVVLGVVAGLIWWANSQKEVTPATGEPIKIGAIFMLSGVGSNWGQNSQRGADLAIEEINNGGGVNGEPLEIVYEDNQGDNAREALNALNKLISDSIKIILGPNWSPSGLAVAPVACQKGVLMISPSLGLEDFNETCDYLFNLWPHDDLLSETMGRFLHEIRQYRRIAILGSLQEWEKTQAEAVQRGFESAGGRVISFQLAQKDQKDFRTEVAKIKASNPEAVVFTNHTFEHLSAKQLREGGVTTPFFTILIDDERIQGAQGAFEGAVVITSFTPSQKFTEKFSAKYGTNPDIGSDTAYDAVQLLAQAMRETSSTDPTVLKEYIKTVKTYRGESGQLVFDGEGGVTKEPQFKVVRNGKLVPYEQAN